ncbi:MAG: hypothetical protein ABS96_15810 [Lysobacteraceae bacterium SCN 69-123]|nr:MAG: hypothetical protein ABS96_15810 [Xanthomonadaceae bacterium SCN 69-123]
MLERDAVDAPSIAWRSGARHTLEAVIPAKSLPLAKAGAGIQTARDSGWQCWAPAFAGARMDGVALLPLLGRASASGLAA